jgi:diguanylate cyclase (GGDEF)-like protein
MILGGALAAWAAPPAPLTTLRAIHALSHAQAAQTPPVAFEATVNYRRQGESTLFVQDGDAAVYVWADFNFIMAPGDRVLIRGAAHDSFRPIVIADSVTVLGHGELPKPAPVTFDQLIRSEFDCMRVSIRARVLSADLVRSSTRLTTHVQLLADGGVVDGYLDNADPKFLDGLLDAEVEATGVAGSKFDGKMQHIGVSLSVPSLADIKVLKRATSNPWTLPVTPMDDILNTYHVKDLSGRVRIHGTITYFQPGSTLVLEDGAKSLWVRTRIEEPLRIGSQADVTGFPDAHDGFLALADGEVQESGVWAPITPRPVTVRELTGSKKVFDLISIEGQVVNEVREGSQDEYVLVSDGRMFSAIIRHPEVNSAQPPPLKEIPTGSRIRVTGVCILENSNPFNREVPFDILMRSQEDIAVVARPSLLNVRNLTIVAGLLFILVVAAGARGWTLDRKVRRQTSAITARIEAEAALERRRSRILEDINGARPLAEIVAEIAELVSFNLDGAPCWCQISDGARLGSCPPPDANLRIVQEKIPARTGPPLGSLFAAFEPLAAASANEAEALSAGAGLATLAIETRRLYTDLLHRSEFDLLTDIRNRFSLDSQMEALIETARQTAGIFGLIYIDLDDFKQINDRHGHHAGDLFLQEVALRMKAQLRGGDMLARLGGDEFAVLLPVVRSRADVEDVARRLERCFDHPFTVEGIVLRGSASVGLALYPEDGATNDSLLSAADAAMYAAKNTRRQLVEVLSASERLGCRS